MRGRQDREGHRAVEGKLTRGKALHSTAATFQVALQREGVMWEKAWS